MSENNAPPDALDVAIIAAKDAPVLGVVEYDGEKYDVIRRPNALLLAELSRLDADDPDAMATLADFFIETMGKSTYKRFRTTFFAHEFDTVEESVEALAALVEAVVTQTMGRPTEPSRN